MRQPTTPAALQPKPIAHGERLFAAGPAFLKMLIQVERHPRQIAQILQQGKQRKKDGHGRQHYRYHPRQHAVYAQPPAALCSQAGA